jgi:hypothetical protein
MNQTVIVEVSTDSTAEGVALTTSTMTRTLRRSAEDAPPVPAELPAEFLAQALAELATPPRDVAADDVDDVVDIWGHGSFPASDPPANW